MLPHADIVIQPHAAKQTQNHNLENDTRDDEVIATVEQLLVVLTGSRGDASADGLDDEAGQVGGEEEARVPLGRDA